MNKRIEDLMQRIKELEYDLALEVESDLDAIRQQLDYTLEKGKIRFQWGALATQRALKVDLYHYLRESSFLFILTSPIIYSLFILLVLLDIFMMIYQTICFPIYRIKKVKRSDYLIIDRQHLAYLNLIEKVNCIYCGYGNGLLSYGVEIALRTESFWCPIKHAKKPRDVHHKYHSFAEYGDAKGYREGLQQFRKKKS